MNTIFCDEFLKDHFGTTYLHLPEMVTDLDDLFNHDDLSDLLNNRRMWAPASLLVMNDTVRVPQAEYFDPPIAPGDGPRLNMEKLNMLIRQGCSLVLKDVIASFQRRLAAWPMHEDDIDITPLLGEDIRYQVSKAVKISLKNNKPHLTDGKKFMELSADLAKALNHVLGQDYVTSSELVTALGYDAAQAESLLAKLKRMGVIR